jgi:uncharacterized iron-regulated membrane protein
MKRFRTFLFWCHLATGLGVGAVVLVMSATGVLLTYQKQITAWADARALAPAAERAGVAPLPVDRLVSAARERVTEGRPTAVTWRAGRPAVQVAFGRERQVFVDPQTGAVLGEGSPGVRKFFRTVTDWHRYLGAGAGDRRTIGKGITGAANLGFLFLVTSGLFLWWPRNWSPRALRSVSWFQRGLSGKARDFNWHNTIGLWAVVPLFVVVLSGVVISYRWAGNLVYRAVGEAAPPPNPQPTPGRGGGGGPLALGGLDTLVSVASRRVPEWRTLTLTLPASPEAPVQFSIDRGMGGEPQKIAQLTLDRATAAEVKWQPFSAGSAGRRLRSILRFAHTGEVLGVVGQTVAGLASLGATVLVWTGLALSLRRWGAWRRRRERSAASEPAVRLGEEVTRVA